MGTSAPISGNPRALLPEDGFTSCPECGRHLGEVDPREHLLREHGYVDLAGIVMPPAAAQTCLWDRVFTTGDLQAHDRLCQLLAAGQPSYSIALEAELRRRADALLSNKSSDFLRLLRCLRQHETARGHLWQLLASPDRRVRELGRRLILPGLAATRDWGQASAADVHRLLDILCPPEDAGEKIRVCQRLTQVGLPAAAVNECLRQLRGEQAVTCPECSVAVPHDQLEIHLRRAHRIYQYQGVRRPLPETIALLFSGIGAAQPDHEAWDALESLAHDECGAGADAFLATGVIRAFQEVDPANQSDVLNAVAEVIGESERGQGLALLLARSTEPIAQQLALRLAPLLPAPLDAGLVAALRPLLRAKRIANELQIAAAAALLRTTGLEGPAALEVVNALATRGGKARAVDRLNQLEERIGPAPLIAERRGQIENQIRMRCPRCGVQLRRAQMAEHLWTEHSLLLDGRRVREPWRLVEDWIAAYRQQGNPELLVRCRALGQHLDPEHGLHRVYRRFLAAGIEDAAARRSLLAEARQRRASLCPRCFTLVPMPDEQMPRPLNQSHGRISRDRFCVEVSENGLVPRLRIENGGALVFDDPEPGLWLLTFHGAMLLLAGPLVAAALLYAVLHNFWHHLPATPVMVFLLAALAVYLAVHFAWWVRPRALDRAVNYAWTRLVPLLGTGEVAVHESEFLASLALTTIHHGQPELRQDELERVLGTVERAVAAGTIPLAHLAALERLDVADAAVLGHDPVPLVVEQVGACFDGRMPLAYAQWLLAEWEGPWWTAGNLARLRLLLCDLAFAAGWEVADLVEAGAMAPALGDVLQTAEPDGLARLRLLWSLRPRRPWPGGEDVLTAFEVALDPDRGRAWLRKHPDLLLLDEGGPTIIVGGGGIVFHETLFTDPPRSIDVKRRRDFEGIEYDVVVDEHRFRLVSDAEVLVGRLVRWFRYHFAEFLPQVPAVYAWKAPEGSKSAQLLEAIACPECRQLLLPRAGQLGTPVTASEPGPSIRTAPAGLLSSQVRVSETLKNPKQTVE
ncbi:MAG TPA: hypothetical protein VKU02_33665 [Gemmataceae bacterium]|nr:hypothetical protein [Gemmataceae bacterium]